MLSAQLVDLITVAWMAFSGTMVPISIGSFGINLLIKEIPAFVSAGIMVIFVYSPV